MERACCRAAEAARDDGANAPGGYFHGKIRSHCGHFARLNVAAFAVTFAIIWGFGPFVLTSWIMAFDGPGAPPTLIGQVYRDYWITPVGSIIGFLSATYDALIGGAVFACLYNSISDYVR
jgi:hypothetical protein